MDDILYCHNDENIGYRFNYKNFILSSWEDLGERRQGSCVCLRERKPNSYLPKWKVNIKSPKLMNQEITVSFHFIIC